MTTPDSFRARLARLWRGLTEPHPAVEEPGERARARLLLNVLLDLMVITAAYGFWHMTRILPLAHPTFDQETAFILGGLVFLALVYLLARTPRYRSAATIFVVGSTLIMYVAITAASESRLDAVWLLFGPLACSLFFPPRATLSLLAVTCLGVLLLPWLGSVPSELSIAESEIFLIFSGLLVVIVAIVHKQDRRRLETKDRALVEHEAMLRESEERYRSLVTEVNDGFYTCDERGVVTFANPALARLVGLEHPDQLVGRSFLEFLTPSPMNEAAALFQQSDTWQEATTIEIGRPDGTNAFAEVRSTPVIETGRVVGLRGVARDVTERELAQKALFESDAMLTEVGRMAKIGGWRIDLATGKLTWTKELYAIHEVDETFEPTVESAIDFYAPEWRPVIQDAVQRAIEDGKPFDLEMELVTAAGRRIWVHALGRAYPENGVASTVAGTFQDISEHKRAEETVRESQERLRQGQRMEAVGGLAGGIAHDFNNLLTAIIGQTELLRGSLCSPEEYATGLGEIRSAADRAANLTRQLLAFSRRQALQPHILNLNDVAESMSGLLKRLLGEDIDLVFQGDPALRPVEADPGQLEQVIMNLALNARDAMPQGGKLTLETHNVELGPEYAATHAGVRPGPHVLLALSDTGTGISNELLPHIFEPFFTTKELGKGTGLGLSTVYGIVKQSGGSIWVYSEPGQGTTFKVYLPRVENAIDWPPASETNPVDTAGSDDATILVVEDELAVLSLTTRVLERQGYEVLGAGSPDEAVALFDRHPTRIDLILSDVMLPGMSGRAMVELLLRRQGVTPRILYMSGYARNAIVHEGRLDEGLSFLEKPFTPDTLVRKVREVLNAPLDGQVTL
ncbi:MAG: PAS domain S-box protein [Actinobacteria bacterium]|nr:PAS domain S-box protein [Actinomycetota bacterium]